MICRVSTVIPLPPRSVDRGVLRERPQCLGHCGALAPELLKTRERRRDARRDCRRRINWRGEQGRAVFRQVGGVDLVIVEHTVLEEDGAALLTSPINSSAAIAARSEEHI